MNPKSFLLLALVCAALFLITSDAAKTPKDEKKEENAGTQEPDKVVDDVAEKQGYGDNGGYGHGGGNYGHGGGGNYGHGGGNYGHGGGNYGHGGGNYGHGGGNYGHGGGNYGHGGGNYGHGGGNYGHGGGGYGHGGGGGCGYGRCCGHYGCHCCSAAEAAAKQTEVKP